MRLQSFYHPDRFLPITLCAFRRTQQSKLFAETHTSITFGSLGPPRRPYSPSQNGWQYPCTHWADRLRILPADCLKRFAPIIRPRGSPRSLFIAERPFSQILVNHALKATRPTKSPFDFIHIGQQLYALRIANPEVRGHNTISPELSGPSGQLFPSPYQFKSSDTSGCPRTKKGGA